ncbi:MAG TPA: AtpZ/AtpI family protein [Byssovorax sp.]|jgi:F0F1-type ATP synthase assembly protein I
MRAAKQHYQALGDFGTLGIEIALSILFPGYVGYWADGKLGTSPWLMLVGGAFGIAAAVRAVMRALARMNKVARDEEREQGNPAPMYDEPEPDAKPPRDEREAPR